MDESVNALIAQKLFHAIDDGQLDYLFQTAHVDYAERNRLTGTSLALGLPQDTVSHLITSVRRAQGLQIMAGAWGDYSAWVTLTAEMVELLHELDTRANFTFSANNDLPEDEIRALQNSILVEEVLPLGLVLGGRGGIMPDNDIERAQNTHAARRMLMEGTEPTTEYEQWVHRFFTLMNRLPELAREPLTLHRLLELHTLLAIDKSTAGVVRTSDVTLRPGAGMSADGLGAPAARIHAEMTAIAAYGTSRQKPFVHPLIKTLVYFYWIRRVQPFETANALFARLLVHIYEYQQGYRSLPLTPLTHMASDEWAVPPPIAEEPRFDATGFVIKRLHLFLDAYIEAEQMLTDSIKRHKMLCRRFEKMNVNHRQARILDEALAVPTTMFTIKRHAMSRGLAYETARQDFLQLVSAGYLEQRKRGRVFEFRLAQDAEKRLKNEINTN